MSKDYLGRKLYSAASKGNLYTVKQIVKEQSNTRFLNINYQSYRKGYTALYIACSFGYIATNYSRSDYYEIVKFLIESGADVNLATYEGKTPLWIAASWGHYHVVALLILKGAHLNVQVPRCSFFTPMHIAAYYQRFHKQYQQKYNSITQHHAYYMAIDYMVRIMQTGVDYKFFPNVRQDYNTLKYYPAENPLENIRDDVMNIVNKYNHFYVVKLLVCAGAEINLTDSNGYAAVQKAQLVEHEAMQQLLIENGAVLRILVMNSL